MLWKLSLTGVKKRMRDYIVLFSGLVIASGIFYMFQSMASNEAFLKANSVISMTVYIFQLGSVLLGIITLIYILYANSFLLAMRQREYGVFMILGAKSRKIAQMIFIETVVIGMVATVIGIVLGMGLSLAATKVLISQLHLSITSFSPVSGRALVITILFFILLFILAAVINAVAMTKKPILSLLRADQTPNEKQRKNIVLAIEAFLGILFLGSGYYLLTQLESLKMAALVGALITIILGTYFVFHAVLVFALKLLKSNERLALKKLNNFTYSQLAFRIQSYTRVLSIVAMLFALALGAITVGLGFRNEVASRTDEAIAYDVTVNNAQKLSDADQEKLQDLQPTLTATYSQKESPTTIYYDKQQFDQEPLQTIDFETKKTVENTGDQLAESPDALRDFELVSQRNKEHQFVSSAEFAALDLPTTELTLVQTNKFYSSTPIIKQLVAANKENNPELSGDDSLLEVNFGQKYEIYEVFNSMFSGFQFMGFFLGIAFLTMLASCLMFKILSGANSDVLRYRMLEKIGARRSLLKASIRKEIGVLFLVPGILGMVHVLFGLQMFTTLLEQPYNKIWVPFTIFFVLYFFYYSITVWIYSSIVLKKQDD
ncbi:MAG: FtsX-like permease family protein [Enterococcus sp.]